MMISATRAAQVHMCSPVPSRASVIFSSAAASAFRLFFGNLPISPANLLQAPLQEEFDQLGHESAAMGLGNRFCFQFMGSLLPAADYLETVFHGKTHIIGLHGNNHAPVDQVKMAQQAGAALLHRFKGLHIHNLGTRPGWNDLEASERVSPQMVPQNIVKKVGAYLTHAEHVDTMMLLDSQDIQRFPVELLPGTLPELVQITAAVAKTASRRKPKPNAVPLARLEKIDKPGRRADNNQGNAALLRLDDGSKQQFQIQAGAADQVGAVGSAEHPPHHVQPDRHSHPRRHLG